jgi:hypothetical protein
MQAIGNGQEDVGVRYHSYCDQNQDREKAKSQAALQSELDREAAIVRSQLGYLRPAAYSVLAFSEQGRSVLTAAMP